MLTRQPALRAEVRRDLILPLAVFATGMALSALAVWLVQRETTWGSSLQFERDCQRVDANISGRLRITRLLLAGAAGLCRASERVTAAEWREFCASFQDMEAMPWLVDVSYLRRVSRSGVNDFLREFDAEGEGGLSMPAAADPEDMIVTVYEDPPREGSPAPVLDPVHDENWRKTLWNAARTGEATLTSHFALQKEGLESVPGFGIVLPIYKRGLAPQNEEERERAVMGWVSSVIRVDRLLEGIVEKVNQRLAFKLFDGAETRRENMLYDTEGKANASRNGLTGPVDYDRTRFHRLAPLDVYGQQWTLDIHALPEFGVGAHAWTRWMILGGGFLVSGFAAGLVWSIRASRSRAHRLAAEMAVGRQREQQIIDTFMQSVPDAIYFKDEQSRFIKCSDSLARKHGLASTSELIDKTDFDFFSEEHARPAFEDEQRIMRTGEPIIGVPEKETYPDGRVGWCLTTKMPWRDANGRIIGTFGISKDITELKRAQEEVAKKEAFFRFVFESVPVGLSWNIPDRDETRIVNSEHVRITGVPADESNTPGVFASRSHPDDLAVQEALVKKVQEGAIDKFTIDKRYIHPDGSMVWTRLTRRHYRDEQGRVTQELNALVDITELKRVQEEMRIAKETAEKANQAKSVFLANMSHEIRTPMNGVIGMTSLLLDTALTELQREYVETVRVSGEALMTIINDILDYSKIESGRLECENEAFNLRECIESALDLLAVRAAEKQLDLLYEISDGVPQSVRGDSARLRQILMNLLGNAVKFTESGEVVLSARAQTLEGQPLPAASGSRSPSSSPFLPPPGVTHLELVFSVRDTGIGISTEGMPRLFQSFSQMDTSTTRRFGGTGLGLAISRRLAEIMGGRIWVESELGRGSTFNFTIHAEIVPTKPQAYQSGSRVQLKGRRMLIVDDNATSRQILTTLARKWGMTSQAARDGPEALSWLQAGETFDVAILDMHMPEMNGEMLAHAIRKIPNTNPPPLILLSSLGQWEKKADNPFAFALTKPVKPSVLYDRLVDLFAREPKIKKVTPAAAPPAGDKKPVQTGRILLAEDNAVNQKVALHMLAALGYRADAVANGLEALEALKRQPYDILFLDVHMPEMDGFETARRIQAEMAGSNVRPWIIALTANAMQGDREACLEAGMDDYLGKPIGKRELAAALARALAARSNQPNP